MSTAQVAMATASSMTGMMAALSMPAQMFALRFSWFSASKRRAFSPSRDIDWTARTPETFSARVP